MKFLKILLLGLLVATPALAQETISDGLTVTIPSSGQKNWFDLFRDSFAKPISGHDHTGSGKGLQIGTNALAASSVTGAKFRLANNETLRARNAANLADVDFFKLDTSNRFTFLPQTIYYDNATTVIAADTADGADTKTLALTGGGAYAAGRGANLLLQGEQAGGAASLFSENGAVNIAAGGANAVVIAANGNTGINILSTGAVNIPLVTASLPVFTDGAKSLITPSIATARTNLGLGTGNTPTFTGVNISGATASLPVFTDGSKNLVTQSVSTAWSTLNAAATYTDWTPTYSGDGTGNLTGVTTVRGRYNQTGKTVIFELEFTATISTADTFWAAFSMPVVAANRSAINWDASVFSSGLNANSLALLGDFSGARGFLYDTATGIIRRGNNKLTNGTTYRFIVSGTYEAA